MDIFKRLLHRLAAFVSIFISTAAVLSTIATLITFLGLGSVVFGYIAGILPLVFVGIGILILSVILFIFIYTLAVEVKKGVANSPTITVYPPPQTRGEFDLLLKEVVYQHFPDGKTMSQRKRFKIRVLRDGVDRFMDRYRWTGTGKCTIKSLTSGFNVANHRKEEFWDYFDVIFPHPLRKNEEADFTIEWELFDAGQAAVPFLSTMIDYETKHLSMRVILPPDLAPKGAYCYEFANYIDTLPISTQPTQWDAATQSINYDVPRPKKYHKYLIRWYS